jgi:hypothetical protein
MFSSVGCSGRRSRKTKEKKPQTFQRPSKKFFKSTVQLNKMGTQLYACQSSLSKPEDKNCKT